ncbi:ABC transporter ATP-binding protein [Anaerosalibacter massiliensis]|uniref:ATP-binding cassette domain-containing protein n=1 Tax=Anaerosalibacter massiliensis TaxID=1347392 RepID=A0A9X2MK89_9FIRM|nr:ATP-binding cassette domain-containing protein [Anaerosalibacter massiliensis]MCR2045573.1 ATP-binding cassette domain-containing protein [Anaerosalibacter massiliensis]
MIEIKKLSKHFKDVIAVDNVSFEVEEGKVFGLLGENGAGKTTTLRMLATMLKPTSGTAIINEYDLIQDPVDIRGEIGILFGGEIGLYDRLSARENIEYFGLLNGMDKAQINMKIEKLAKDLEMEEYIDRKVGKFSKGMKQKVAIARSIIHSPSIMFFDEPTSGLDVTAIRVVHEFIKELRNEGKTIIFSSHSMNEVEKLCDEVGIIHKGKMVEISSLEGLKVKYGEENLEEIFVSLVGEKNE